MAYFRFTDIPYLRPEIHFMNDTTQAVSDLTVQGIKATPCGKCASTKLQHDRTNPYHEIKCLDCDNRVRNYIGPHNAVDEWNRQQPRLRDKRLKDQAVEICTPPEPDLLPCACGNAKLNWSHESTVSGGNPDRASVECPKCHYAATRLGELRPLVDQWNSHQRGAHPCPECSKIPEVGRLYGDPAGPFTVDCCTQGCTGHDEEQYLGDTKSAAWQTWQQHCGGQAEQHPGCPDCGGKPTAVVQEYDDEDEDWDAWYIKCSAAGCPQHTVEYSSEKRAWAAWAMLATPKKSTKPLRTWKCAFCSHEFAPSVDRPSICPECRYQGFTEITKQEKTTVNEKYQCIYCSHDIQTQDRAGRRSCTGCGRTAFRKIKQNPTTEEKQMNDIKNTFDKTNQEATAAAKQGAKQAIAITAQEAIMEQARRLLGDQFPDDLYATPFGAAALNMGMCYAVLFAANAFPDMPGAPEVQEYSQAALVGCTAKSFAPMMQIAQELFAGVVAQAKAAGIEAPSVTAGDSEPNKE